MDFDIPLLAKFENCRGAQRTDCLGYIAPSTPVWIYAVVAACVFVVGAGVGMFIWRRHQSKSAKPKTQDVHEAGRVQLSSVVYSNSGDKGTGSSSLQVEKGGSPEQTSSSAAGGLPLKVPNEKVCG
jgi:hypothetical protein